MLLPIAAAASLITVTTAPAFDLSQTTVRDDSRENAMPAEPIAPRGMDTRSAAPEVEMALLDAETGPVLRVGAFGGKHRAAPKLAHVALGWRF